MKYQSLSFLLLIAGGALHADEGLWLYNQFPKSAIAAKYRFEPTQEFLDHLRLSSIRMGGGSASFVSPNGLIFTNHHVARRCIAEVSTSERDYNAIGFYAAAADAEVKCPGMEINVLLSIEDSTAQVTGAVKSKPESAEANQERQAAIARIEKDCVSKTGNRCNIVTLHAGALYHLYQYKKYTDVRLVFAPEEAIAFFGGDPDNFTYPRFDLDITFLRAYEDDKPALTPNWLKWSRTGPKVGELALVSGHPGSTDRFITLARMEYLRDISYPRTLKYYESIIKALKAYGAQSAENRRVANSKLFGAENTYKVRAGEFKGLQDPSQAAAKKEREDKLRAQIQANSAIRAQVGGAFEEIASAYGEWRKLYKDQLLETGPQFSDLFTIARNVLRLSEERAKPNEKRLPEYADAALPSLEIRLYSKAPITDSVEIVVLTTYFQFLVDELGADHATVKAILEGRSSENAARVYVESSKLKDIAERKRLASDAAAAKISDDGMMRLVRLLDEPARANRRTFEDRVQAVETAAASRIARARFELQGASAYPDATGTLRLSYGAVKGYKNAEGNTVPPLVDFAGLYNHATGVEPFKLPQRWLDSKSVLNLKVPFNFVSTADIIGGNSGSPTVNTRGEIIGIIFDTNYEAMPNRFIYGEERGQRSVHVTSQGIIEALRKVYKADRVLAEIGSTR